MSARNANDNNDYLRCGASPARIWSNSNSNTAMQRQTRNGLHGLDPTPQQLMHRESNDCI
jgi:hypothetical protein